MKIEAKRGRGRPTQSYLDQIMEKFDVVSYDSRGLFKINYYKKGDV